MKGIWRLKILKILQKYILACSVIICYHTFQTSRKYMQMYIKVYESMWLCITQDFALMLFVEGVFWIKIWGSEPGDTAQRTQALNVGCIRIYNRMLAMSPKQEISRGPPNVVYSQPMPIWKRLFSIVQDYSWVSRVCGYALHVRHK